MNVQDSDASYCLASLAGKNPSMMRWYSSQMTKHKEEAISNQRDTRKAEWLQVAKHGIPLFNGYTVLLSLVMEIYSNGK